MSFLDDLRNVAEKGVEKQTKHFESLCKEKARHMTDEELLEVMHTVSNPLACEAAEDEARKRGLI